MDDLISRQAAIEALRRAEALTRAFGYHNVIDTIRELPSVQPEIIRCKDCKYFDPLTEDFDYNFCDAWAGGTNEDMFCGFAERRQDADSSGNMSGTQKELKCTETHECVYQRTGTHEPQRLRGKWETIEGWDGDDVYRCSECGEEYVLIDGTPKENGYNFCPNCGADMRGTE